MSIWTLFISEIFLKKHIWIFKSRGNSVEIAGGFSCCSIGIDSSFLHKLQRHFKESQFPALGVFLICYQRVWFKELLSFLGTGGEPAQKDSAAWTWVPRALRWSKLLKSLAPLRSGRASGCVGVRKPKESLPRGNAVTMLSFSTSRSFPNQKRKGFW